MTGAAGAATARASAWVDHLRAGGTTPWREWLDSAADDSATDDSAPHGSAPAPAVPAGDLLPGAQQLELLRRVNLAARGLAGAPPASLVERVLAASATGRGALDLQLLGAHDGRAFGPRPVDPALLPEHELLRVAVGLLAEDAAAGRLDAGPLPPPGRPLPWRRHPQLVGDPVWAASVTEQLAAQRSAPGRPDVLVLGGDLERLLAAVWTTRVVEGGAPSWRGFCDNWAERGKLPPRADLAAVAAARTADGRRVRIVTDASSLTRLTRARRPLVAPAPVPQAVTELALQVSHVLGLLVTAERLRGLTRTVLDAGVTTAAGLPGPWPAPAVPLERRSWLLREARLQREALTAAEYPVHGTLEELLPAAAPAIDPPAERHDEAAVLALAVRMLLGSDQGPIHPGAREETRNHA